MSVTVRFAPSPTGRLHIGNTRTALLNWLFAQQHSGRFMLRMDDTDTARSTEAFAEAIERDLAWLGLAHDLFDRQSGRIARYEAIADKLKVDGRLYACYETPQELERKRKRQLLRGLPPVYDREGLSLGEAERAVLEAQGRHAHWRFKLQPANVVWDDAVRGLQSVDCASLSDPVLVREDGSYLYTLPSVVDDIDHGITHVIRGEDHVANTAPQIQLFEALGQTPPSFAHHSLLVNAEGGRLSKRDGALSLGDMAEAGLEAMAVASYAATIGTSDPVEPHQSLDDLVARFDFAKLSRAPARFDPDELALVNARLLHGRAYAAVAGELTRLGVGGGEAFWLAVRGNLEILADARTWWDIAQGPVAPAIGDEAEYCRTAAGLLPPEPWDGNTWSQWTGAVSETTKRKGRRLFAPLRFALTGQGRGPELSAFLPFIGRERAEARLSGRRA
ncbi:Glutamyl-tRNA(Gln) synthetase [hydrothermal vent metagenome]|uniref:Glutamyl-tRNA(Gln) synthetase n=1 Tax=hydrothermal vent metagenome TaxID=652676 RepID=A0A3B0SVR1_9ZZZZ